MEIENISKPQQSEESDVEGEILKPSFVQKPKPTIEVNENDSYTIEAKFIASPFPDKVRRIQLIVSSFVQFLKCLNYY